MEHKIIVSLLIGYTIALLPIWDWNTRPELFAGTIVLSITCLAILVWLQEKRRAIKKALTSANMRGSKENNLIYKKYKTKQEKKQGENKMLKKDFDGYLEFMQKVQEADNEETEKLYKERTQLYVDKIQDVIGVTPSGDLVFIITALRMITEAAQKLEPEATRMAQKLFDGMSYSSKSGTFNANTTEAAARVYADILKRQ